MVSFICNACGQTVKKNQVEKHYQSDCPNCEVLSCIDCGKDFHGNDYSAHTSCITEAEKYQGKLYKPKDKQNKGEQKQQEWIKRVKEASGAGSGNPKIQNLLERISEYSNVPRKKAKFQNFCRNSLRVHDDTTLNQLWEIFSESVKGDQKTSTDVSNGDSKDRKSSSEISTLNEAEESEESEEKRKSSKKRMKGKSKSSESNTCRDELKNGEKRKQKDLNEDGEYESKKKRKGREEEEAEEEEENMERKSKNSNISEEYEGLGDGEQVVVIQGNGKFVWKTTIKRVLKEAPDHELPLKKLRKKVLAEFLARGGDNKHRSENELRALFEKKVSKNPMFKVHKERVKLCK